MISTALREERQWQDSVVMYNKPADAAAFDAYYFKKHVPLAKTIPGLRSYEVNANPIGTPQGPSSLLLIAILTFDSMAAIAAAFASEEGHRRRRRQLRPGRRADADVRHARGVSGEPVLPIQMGRWPAGPEGSCAAGKFISSRRL